jgi:hypothetical protein
MIVRGHADRREGFVVRLKNVTCVSLILLAGSIAYADVFPVGFISYDVNIPKSTASFDITNETGPNASVLPDTTFPIATTVNLTSLSLKVDFSDGSSQTFGAAYFTTASDGISFDGGVIPIGGANPQPTDATLTGMFNPTAVTLTDGTSWTLAPAFSTEILPSSPPNLADGDFGIINATATPAGTSPVPEPGAVILLVTAVALLLLPRERGLKNLLHRCAGLVKNGAAPLALVLACALLIPAANAQVKLNVSTSPSTGVAGVDYVNVTGSGYPVGHGTFPTASATVSFSLSCGGAVAATATPASIINILGSSYRWHVQLPGTLTTNTYFVSVSGTTSDGTAYSSITCSQVAVTHTNPTLSACVPTSSLGIVAPVTGPAAVKALVPNGCWECGLKGVQVVQLETGGGPVVAPASVVTAGVINSCAGNPATGEGVCVDNGTGVYLLDPTNTVTTLASGANRFASFSGGSCENCGVSVNALTNQAVINMGVTGGASGDGVQVLDLGTNTFQPPFGMASRVSENTSIDPTRGYILSPNEGSNYDILQFNSTTGAVTGEFLHSITTPTLTLDSAGEDCATGIALSVGEFSNNVVLADLTQSTFTPGAPGSWTAPVSEPAIIGSYAAGLSGIAVAPGSSHVAVVTGEFGGSSFSVLKLPATSGTGTPAIVDYAYVPCLTGFSAGFDPHTLSAYTSPNDGKAYGVFANWISGAGAGPQSLYVADLAAILAAPRLGDGHTVIGDSGSCLAPGDGLIRSVATH